MFQTTNQLTLLRHFNIEKDKQASGQPVVPTTIMIVVWLKLNNSNHQWTNQQVISLFFPQDFKIC